MNVIEKVKNNKYKNYIVIIIIIIVFYSLFKLYKYFQNKTDNEPYLINGVRKCNYVLQPGASTIGSHFLLYHYLDNSGITCFHVHGLL